LKFIQSFYIKLHSFPFCSSALIFLIISLFSFQACKPKLATLDASQNSGDTQTIGIKKEFRWTKTNLSVCWLNDNPYYDAYKKQVKEVVTKNVHKTIFRLSGWGNCDRRNPIASGDVRIFIYDDPKAHKDPWFEEAIAAAKTESPERPGAPRAEIAMRRKFLSSSYTVILNESYKFGLKEKTMNIYAGLTSRGQQLKKLSDMVHEFGHVLGLFHEHVHEEASCHGETGEEFNAKYSEIVAPYNSGSIMTYCGRNMPYYNTAVEPTFTEKDIFAVNKMYAYLK
jgi:hypothetical protein